MALFGGATAVATPLLGLLYPAIVEMAFFVTLPSMVLGLYTAVMSWRRQERFRYWAVLGGALAIIPFFF